MTHRDLSQQFPPPDWQSCANDGTPQAPLELYHCPDSVGSQQIRLALAEKGVEWTGHIVNPLLLGELQPKYLQLNPRGRLPTLVDGGCVVYDTNTLLDYLDSHYKEPVMTPDREVDQGEMRRWLEVAARFPLRELSTALQTGWRGRLARRFLSRRLSAIAQMATRHPEYQGIYEAQLGDTRHWLTTVRSAGEIRRCVQLGETILQRMNQILGRHTYLAGDQPSWADTVWVPILHRMQQIGMQRIWENGRLPKVAAYLERMRERPAFDAAICKFERPAQQAKMWLPFFLPRIGLAIFFVSALLLSLLMLF
jgi:glutathione S-transferase